MGFGDGGVESFFYFCFGGDFGYLNRGLDLLR